MRYYRLITLTAYGMIVFLLSGLISSAAGQVEDTTRTESPRPGQTETNRYNDFINTPYQIDVPKEQIIQYRLNDYGSTYSFYRRLQYYGIEDYLFEDEEVYEMYGYEWERKINENLTMVLNATFKEDNKVLQFLNRIAPFIGIGFFEPYEVPIVPRREGGDKVYTED